jgi:DNA invertase Pin-like site-specific DNA recombinase
MRTALYVRVSTLQQKPDLQHDGLRAYAARTGLEIVADYSPTATLIGKSFNFNEI